MRLVLAAVAVLAVALVPEAQVQAREGIITVVHARGRAGIGANARATFSDADTWGIAVGHDGPCTLYRGGHGGGMSAGTITITGTTAPIMLHPDGASGHVYYQHAGDVPEPPFVEGATITATASGGPDVPAFSASVSAPAELRGYAGPKTVSRAGTEVTWTAGSGSGIEITLGGLDDRAAGGWIVRCRVPDTGHFTIPAATFARIPPSVRRVFVIVDRVAETVQMVGGTRVVVGAVSSVVSGEFPLEPAVRCETTPSRFVSVAYGYGGVSRIENVPPTYGATGRVQLGQRLAHRLHLVEEFDSIGGGYTSVVVPASAEDHVVFGAGLRWMPFEPRPTYRPTIFLPGPFTDLQAWYVTALVGADFRDRITETSPTTSRDASSWSPMASLSLGLLEIRGHDWSMGPEFREQLTRYDGHIQRSWQAMIAIHLEDY